MATSAFGGLTDIRLTAVRGPSLLMLRHPFPGHALGLGDLVGGRLTKLCPICPDTKKSGLGRVYQLFTFCWIWPPRRLVLVFRKPRIAIVVPAFQRGL